jgi:hypothetical protein
MAAQPSIPTFKLVLGKYALNPRVIHALIEVHGSRTKIPKSQTIHPIDIVLTNRIPHLSWLCRVLNDISVGDGGTGKTTFVKVSTNNAATIATCNLIV